jgi:putative phage-type endonuclease
MKVTAGIKTLEMTYEEWKEARMKGIGGSDAAAAIGVSRWKSPLQLYLEKAGEIEQPEAGEVAYWGNVLESVVADEFAKRTDKKVQRVNRILIHPEYQYMIANIDRRVVGENAILECKTTGAWNAKDWEGEEIPAEYIVQVMHYLAVTGADKAYFAVLIGGTRFAWKELNRDEELIEMMTNAEMGFWNYVVSQTPPPLSESRAELTAGIMDKLYPEATGGMSDLPPTYTGILEQLIDVKSRIKELEVSEDYLASQIKEYMKEAERANVGRFTVNWKNVTTKRFDTKLFEKTNPDLYSQYVKESQSRRFTVKEETV